MINYYAILGVGRDASNEDIKRAYRKKAFEYHPDRNQNSSLSQDKFRLVTEAYRVLLNDVLRSKHDNQLDIKHTLASKPAHDAYPFQEPTPYGSAFTQTAKNNPYQNVSEESIRNATFRRYRPVGSHDIAIAMLFMASLILGGVWLHSVMSRKAAEQSFEEGKYRDALYFDSTYAPAWHAWAVYSFRDKDYSQALSLNNKAIFLSDAMPESYYRFKLEVALILNDSSQVSQSVQSYLKDSIQTDTLHYLIASAQINVLNQPAKGLTNLQSIKSVNLSAQTSTLRAKALLNLGRLLEAQQLLDQLIDSKTGDATLHLIRGQARLQLQDTLGACYDFQMASLYGNSLGNTWAEVCK